jgi:hypothetical protein
MAFVQCMSCKSMVNEQAKFCGECGQRRDVPVLTREAVGGPPVYDRRTESTRPRCPGCAGETFRKLSLVVSSGVSHVSTRSSGLGVGLGGGIAVGGANTRGVHVTELARKVSPPQPMSVFKAVLLGFLIGAVLSAMMPAGASVVAGLLVLAGPIVGGYIAVQHNRNVYAPAYTAWERKFMCDRCGEIFTL